MTAVLGDPGGSVFSAQRAESVPPHPLDLLQLAQPPHTSCRQTHPTLLWHTHFTMAEQQQQYVVVVQGAVKTQAHLDTFLANFRPLAAHVHAHESECSVYEISLSETNPLAFIIYERYSTKQYFEQVHCTSESFKAFMASLEGEGSVEWAEPMKVTTYLVSITR